jgi:hypothetical protein
MANRHPAVTASDSIGSLSLLPHAIALTRLTETMNSAYLL